MSAIFDAVAKTYDDTFTGTTLGRWLRSSVRAYISKYFAVGDLVLELGCGTGEDAVWLADRGIAVHATDVSPAMLEETRKKVMCRNNSTKVAVSLLNLSEVDTNSPPPRPAAVGVDGTRDTYDGVLANFGVLNCLDEWDSLSGGLARVVRRGGVVIGVVMGPYCPWEWAWFLSRGSPHRAFRRLRGPLSASIGNGARLQVRYPSPSVMKRSFAPEFEHRSTAGIGVVLPPSYANNLVERRKKWFARLVSWDRCLAQTIVGRWLNDHYLIVLERRA
jgi:SAM-dependent methyltransferase